MPYSLLALAHCTGCQTRLEALDLGVAPDKSHSLNPGQGESSHLRRFWYFEEDLKEGAVMDINEAISGRRSTREYTSEAVDEAMIGRLIDAAVLAPNAVNQQPWTFTVVRDQAVLDRISREAKSHMLATLPAGEQSAHFRSILDDASYHIFYHAPVLILISAAGQSSWAVEDCALAAENLMLTAYANGLGSCWIGFAQSYLNTPEGKSMLDAPANSMPVAPIIVGHPRAMPPPVARKAPEVRWIG
jgi:nitroreductase